MHLVEIALTHFKNYPQLTVAFKQPVTCFVGNNGVGKTNLLDAIYYLCIGKSYFNAVEQQNMADGATFMRLEGHFSTAEKENVLLEAITQKGSKKVLRKNSVPYEKLADHLGFLPVTFIAPDDNVLILDGSEVRRRFLNASISQFDQRYLYDLMRYNKLLSQRNAALKAERIDDALLNTYDEQMIPLGTNIYRARLEFTEKLVPFLLRAHAAITGKREMVSCAYKSQLATMDFGEKLRGSRERDRVLRRSTSGIHRDDLEFLIHEEKPLKKYGSQGQQKSFLLALKLAQYKFIQEKTGKNPILLLDDIFDKLDRERIRRLFGYIFQEEMGQVFMTDTNGERLQDLLTEFQIDFGIFRIQGNEILGFGDNGSGEEE